MNQKRPVNLDLRTIKFPLPAIGSILHRISGFILFFFIPLFLWALGQSLSSAKGFAEVSQCLGNPVLKFFVWAFLSALIYHLLAGIRHLFMDIGIGENLGSARRGTSIVFILSVVLIILLGWWLW
jgi:succinate dehydrogenase / fumarate reductase cytochrome b subunit